MRKGLLFLVSLWHNDEEIPLSGVVELVYQSSCCTIINTRQIHNWSICELLKTIRSFFGGSYTMHECSSGHWRKKNHHRRQVFFPLKTIFISRMIHRRKLCNCFFYIYVSLQLLLVCFLKLSKSAYNISNLKKEEPKVCHQSVLSKDISKI